MSTRDAVLCAFHTVAAQQGRRVGPIDDALRLVDSGLDSLGRAVVATMLVDELGVDPFASGEWVDFPTTFGELVALYESALASRSA